MQLSADLQRFFELSPDLCCVMALDGTIRATNAAWFAVLGYGDGELANQRLLDLLHPDDRVAAETELVRNVRSTFSARCRGKDGSYRALRWRSTAMLESKGICAIARVETATMSSSERMLSLGQIALGVVHDLKNVLVHPLGLQLQRVERSLEAKELDKARSAITAMRNVLRDGLEAIDRMQHFTRPTSVAKRTRVDVENIMWRATEIARAYARTASSLHDIEIAYQPAKAKKIDADAFELLAALVNVLFNAIDAVAERGGKVAVRTGTALSTRRVWFEIVDDGPGMTSNVRDRIFEPFFTTKPDGIGIGLTMVKTCIERHAGAIAIDSTPGSGTTFRIELPMP